MNINMLKYALIILSIILSSTFSMAEQCTKLDLEITGKLGKNPVSFPATRTDDNNELLLEVPLHLIDISDATMHIRFHKETKFSYSLEFIPKNTADTSSPVPIAHTSKFNPLEFDDYGVQLIDQSYWFSLDKIGVPNRNRSFVKATIKSLIIDESNDTHTLAIIPKVEQVACENFGDLDVYNEVNGGRQVTVEHYAAGEGEKAMYEDWLRGQELLNATR